MKPALVLLLAICGALPGSASADHLQPVDPILPDSVHLHENHDGHDHAGVELSGDFTGASFRGANLTGATFTRLSDWDSSTATEADFGGAILVDSYFWGNRFIGVNFVGADFRGAVFNEPRFVNADFSGVDFSAVTVDEPEFIDSNLRGANFRSSEGLMNAFLGTISMIHVDLRDIDFRGAVLPGLQDVDMRGDDLRGAKFISQDVSNSVFDATTIYDSATVFPPGFDPVAHGLTFVPEPSTLALLLAALPLGYLTYRRR